jgi:hypothetical protein
MTKRKKILIGAVVLALATTLSLITLVPIKSEMRRCVQDHRYSLVFGQADEYKEASNYFWDKDYILQQGLCPTSGRHSLYIL